MLPPKSPENLRAILERDYTLGQRVHRESGLLATLANGTEGIRAIDNKEYTFPTKQEVIERLMQKQEVIATKLTQYHNPKILIIPFGMRILDLAESWKGQIVKHKDKLHNRDGSNVESKATYDTTKYALEQTDAPVRTLSKYANDNDVVYDPQVFDPDPTVRQGKSKS